MTFQTKYQAMCLLLLACLAVPGNVVLADTDDAKLLSTSILLKFEFAGHEVSVSTSTSQFSIESTFEETHTEGEDQVHMEQSVDVTGAVTEGKGDRPWMVQIRGIFSFQERHFEVTNKGGKIPATLNGNGQGEEEQFTVQISMNLEISAYLEPGKKKLVASQSGHDVWITLELPDDR